MFEIFAYDIVKGKMKASIQSSLLEKILAHKRYVIILENGLDLAIILLEIYKRKAVAIPIAPSLADRQVAHLIEHADADGVFKKTHGAVEYIPRISQNKSPKDHRFIIYTSGSTGNPKGVIQTDESVMHNAMATANAHQFSTDSPHATCLPLYHCNGLMMSLIGCYLTDTPLLLLPKFEPVQYFEHIRYHNVTTASIVPAMLPELLRKRPEWPVKLRYLITAAAPLTRQLAKKFFDIYKNKIVQGYGLSEAVNFSFLMPFLEKKAFVENYIWCTPPVGLPIKGTEFKLEKSGEVCVKGPNNMQGYWKNNSATRQCLDGNNWLKTGDIGTIRNEYLVLTGRIKETINRGGESLHPIEIEERFREFLADDIFFLVVPTQHAELDNEIGVVVDVNSCNPSKQQKQMILSRLFSCDLMPASVAFKKVSKTATGKPKRITEGMHIYVFQGSNYEVLQAIWSLRFCSQLATKHRVNIEGAITKIIPKKNKIIFMAEFKSKEQTIEKSFDSMAKNMIHSFLRNFLIFNDAINCNLSHHDINQSVKVTCRDKKTIHYYSLEDQSLVEKDILSMKSNQRIIYFDMQEKLNNNMLNPLFHSQIIKAKSSHSANDFSFTPLNLDSEKYWFYISPIKFKQYIFISLVVIGCYE